MNNSLYAKINTRHRLMDYSTKHTYVCMYIYVCTFDTLDKLAYSMKKLTIFSNVSKKKKNFQEKSREYFFYFLFGPVKICV